MFIYAPFPLSPALSHVTHSPLPLSSALHLCSSLLPRRPTSPRRRLSAALLFVCSGFQPWHATGYAASALFLLGAPPRYNNTYYAALAANSSAWEPTLDALLNTEPSQVPIVEYGAHRAHSAHVQRVSLTHTRTHAHTHTHTPMTYTHTHVPQIIITCFLPRRSRHRAAANARRLLYLQGCSSIHGCAHKIVAIPAVMSTETGGAEKYMDFLNWSD